MNDITKQALHVVMQKCPVWATHMAGRLRVFTDPEIPTAALSGSNGRLKILINDELAEGPDFQFILMHELAHMFRNDLVSMRKYPEIAGNINVAADCIINDKLVQLGIPRPELDGCYGQDIFGRNCADASINELIKLEVSEEAMGKASEPGNVNQEGERIVGGQGGEEENTESTWGTDPDLSGKIGIGGREANYTNARELARSLVGYARRMFFEAGFKSRNISSRMDWRRNRSSFAAFHDVVIPRTTVGEFGHEHHGPLVNLVLDVSGSMNQEWVRTAATIADEIHKGGLDFDLWLTPVRQKAKDPKQLLRYLLDGETAYGQGIDKLLHPRSFDHEAHTPGHHPQPHHRGPSNAVGAARDGEGADELYALRWMETEDPVVWVYIGDYFSTIGFDLHYAPNFLHVPISNESYYNGSINVLQEKGLPRWIYTP